jgi:quercetin dioxygenase-like cupin family protein
VKTPCLAWFVLSTTLLAQDPVAIDRLHYTVELDNSQVRVLRVRYKPGEGSALHEHPAGVRIFLTDIRNRFSLPDGSKNEVSRRAGEIIWAEPVRHENVNIGSNSVEILELEIKGLPKRPARVVSSGSSETVVLENEFVRVFRSKGGHRTSVTDAVVVSRAGGQVLWNPRDVPPDSVVVELIQK